MIIRIPNGFLLKNFVYIGIKDGKIMARIARCWHVRKW